MPFSLVNTLTTTGWSDPEGGGFFKIPVASVLIEKGIISEAGTLVKKLSLGSSYLVVSDVTTHDLLGRRLESVLASLGKAASLVFPMGVRADKGNVAHIIQAAAMADVIVAVGSGTINDLCKYASFLAGKPYIIFGTAPSMNGYGSANASITVDGHKKTLPCHLPHAIFLDLGVLSSAPKRLIRSGLGDSICRSTAQADWLLSHLLLKTPYSEVPFRWLKHYEEALFEQSAALVEGDKEVMRLLCHTLVLSGFGMVVSGGSYPASQGEHSIAHTMEMAYGSGTGSYHGEQIAVTTLTMAALQYALLEQVPVLKPKDFPKEEMVYLLGKECMKECRKEFDGKKMGSKKMAAINDYLHRYWSGIQGSLMRVMVPEQKLRAVLQAAGAPLCALEIGWQEERYKQALRYAGYTRNRFTFLDLMG